MEMTDLCYLPREHRKDYRGFVADQTKMDAQRTLPRLSPTLFDVDNSIQFWCAALAPTRALNFPARTIMKLHAHFNLSRDPPAPSGFAF